MGIVDHIINQAIVGTKSEPKYINASFPSTVSALVGKLRWYPPASVTLKTVSLYIGTAPVGSDLVVDVKKNGVSIFGSTKPTIVAGANTSTPITVSTTLTTTDYLTVDVISGSGTAMTVRIDYQ